MTRYPLLVALVLALAACKGGEKERGGTAEGRILPGSASDAMIQYDRLTSQPPLAPARADKAGAPDAAASEEASDAASPDTGASPVPAPETAPAAQPAPTKPASPKPSAAAPKPQ